MHTSEHPTGSLEKLHLLEFAWSSRPLGCSVILEAVCRREVCYSQVEVGLGHDVRGVFLRVFPLLLLGVVVVAAAVVILLVLVVVAAAAADLLLNSHFVIFVRGIAFGFFPFVWTSLSLVRCLNGSQ